MRVASLGPAVFAATLVGLGVWGLAVGHFAPIWQPVPAAGAPMRRVLALACAVVSLAAGGGLLWRRTAAPAAGVLTIWLLLWMLAFRAPAVVAAPAVAAVWEGCGETAVLVAAAWALFSAADHGRASAGLAGGANGLRGARALYGLALIAFGVAHLAYLKATAALVPAWLPAALGWALFTGLAYIAAGAAIAVGVLPRLAARLAALQMGLFTLLVWAPRLAAGGGASDWSEAVISWTLTAGGWAIAASYEA
jgi:hypothetical protein